MVKCGIDRIGEFGALFRGKRLGMVTSVSGVTLDLRPGYVKFHEVYPLVCLFGPEHGMYGKDGAGEDVDDVARDSATGLPVYSLYGGEEGRHIAPERLETLDAVVYDIQDLGTRFYTFISTLLYVMEDCAAAGRELIVLDRPAPLDGVTVEGGLLEPEYCSFVGAYPLCIRYGLTAGVHGKCGTKAGLPADGSTLHRLGAHAPVQRDGKPLDDAQHGHSAFQHGSGLSGHLSVRGNKRLRRERDSMPVRDDRRAVCRRRGTGRDHEPGGPARRDFYGGLLYAIRFEAQGRAVRRGAAACQRRTCFPPGAHGRYTAVPHPGDVATAVPVETPGWEAAALHQPAGGLRRVRGRAACTGSAACGMGSGQRRFCTAQGGISSLQIKQEGYRWTYGNRSGRDW